MEGQRQTLMNAMNEPVQTQLTIDDIKGVVGSMVIDSIIKEKRIAELTAEVAQLKKELENVHTEK
jgi:uncharacterized protein YeeX (DUF496 family)